MAAKSRSVDQQKNVKHKCVLFSITHSPVERTTNKHWQFADVGNFQHSGKAMTVTELRLNTIITTFLQTSGIPGHADKQLLANKQSRLCGGKTELKGK